MRDDVYDKVTISSITGAILIADLGVFREIAPTRGGAISWNPQIRNEMAPVILLGARKDKNTRRAHELAESFFAAHDIPNRKITRRRFPLIEKSFHQGFAAYEVNEAGRFALKYLPSRFDKIGKPHVNIGITKSMLS